MNDLLTIAGGVMLGQIAFQILVTIGYGITTHYLVKKKRSKLEDMLKDLEAGKDKLN